MAGDMICKGTSPGAVSCPCSVDASVVTAARMGRKTEVAAAAVVAALALPVDTLAPVGDAIDRLVTPPALTDTLLREYTTATAVGAFTCELPAMAVNTVTAVVCAVRDSSAGAAVSVASVEDRTCSDDALALAPVAVATETFTALMSC